MVNQNQSYNRKIALQIKFHFVLVTAILFIQMDLLGQNLISDPGFEQVSRRFDGSDTVYTYERWTSLLGFKKLSPEGLPLYSVYLKGNSNNKYLKYWMPYEGDSFMFSHIVNSRNLYQTKLINELTPGEMYKINFKYKILADGFTKEKIESSINIKIGVMLTTKDMTDSSGLRIIKNRKIVLKPQILLNSFDADSINMWLDLTTYYVPKKTYFYFIIGNFQELIGGHELTYHPIRGVSYRIDQVNIELVEKDSGIRKNTNKSTEASKQND